jgi:hypothetical protein
MSKTHKAILIDVHAFEVRELEIERDNLTDIYANLFCDTFDAVSIDTGDAVYVDDEGLIRGNVDRYFAIAGYTAILAGNGLVMGVDAEGGSVDPLISIDEVKRNIAWFVRGKEGWLHRVVPRASNKAPSAEMTFVEFNNG